MQFSHVLSRGVDKRKIFLDNQDYYRFIHDLFEFNDVERTNTTYYRFHKCNDIASRNISPKRKQKTPLVDIHMFCLVPNHYHLLLSPRIEGGISKFMKKVNMGYAKYFNQKYDRTGTLFEGRFKSVPIKSDAHLVHIPYYIHFNALDLIMPEWRRRELKDYNKAYKFLETYRWSSHPDYIGKKNFPSVTNRKFFLEFFGGTDGYNRDIKRWLYDLVPENFRDLLLE